MRIAVDGRMYQESGIGRYIRNLISNLQILDRKNEYFILHKSSDYDTLVYHNNFKKILTDFRWYGVSEQIKLPKILNQLKPDLVHFPHFNVPIFYNGRFVVTIHDLIHQHFQMRRATTLDPIIYKIKQLGYSKVFKTAISKSVHILVPSEYIKKLLVNEWRIENSKITVTSEAVDDKISTTPLRASSAEVALATKAEQSKPYLFYVGNAHPHKNIEGLIKVFLKLKEKYQNLSLVLSGYDHYFWQRIKKENQYHGIIYTGWVSDEELVALYKNALCFIMPSFEEGFGIPLLEAFASECPVVSSDAGALPEIGGDACLYFDPLNTSDMLSKIIRILDDENLRKSLIERGKKRVKLFSWRKLATQTLEVYKQCELP